MGGGTIIPASAQRVVQAEDEIWRFMWRLLYRDGREVAQYENHSGHLIQTMFAKQNPRGVLFLRVFDFLSASRAPLLTIDIPQEAEVDILLNRKIEQDKDTGAFGPILTCYTFGWCLPGLGGKGRYVNLAPPGEAWESRDRYGKERAE